MTYCIREIFVCWEDTLTFSLWAPIPRTMPRKGTNANKQIEGKWHFAVGSGKSSAKYCSGAQCSQEKHKRALNMLVCACARARVHPCLHMGAHLCLFQPGEVKSRTNQKLPDSGRPFVLWTLRLQGQLVERRGENRQTWETQKRVLWLQRITHLGEACVKDLYYTRRKSVMQELYLLYVGYESDWKLTKKPHKCLEGSRFEEALRNIKELQRIMCSTIWTELCLCKYVDTSEYPSMHAQTHWRGSNMCVCYSLR